jgi:hypothetical protein
MSSAGKKKADQYPQVLLYPANIIDYARVGFLIWALQYDDWRYAVLYTLSYFLDVFDGMVARAMGQTSNLGCASGGAAPRLPRIAGARARGRRAR